MFMLLTVSLVEVMNVEHVNPSQIREEYKCQETDCIGLADSQWISS